MSLVSGVVERSTEGKEVDPRERGVEEIQMMDGNEKEKEKGVDPPEVAVEGFLMMFGSSIGEVSGFPSAVIIFC